MVPEVKKRFLDLKTNLITTHTQNSYCARPAFFIRYITMNQKLQYANEYLITSSVFCLYDDIIHFI
jgi:hypothetical protein